MSISVVTARDIFEWMREKEKLWEILENLRNAHRKLIDLVCFGVYRDGKEEKKFRDVFDEDAQPYFIKTVNELLSYSLAATERIGHIETKIINETNAENLVQETEKKENIFGKIVEGIKNLFKATEEETQKMVKTLDSFLTTYKNALSWIKMQGEPRRKKELLNLQLEVTKTMGEILDKTQRYILEQIHKVNQLIPAIAK